MNNTAGAQITMNIKSDVKQMTAARLTTFDNGWTVETWWDSDTRSYVTQTKDSEGNQQGNAEYSGSGVRAKAIHGLLVEACGE